MKKYSRLQSYAAASSSGETHKYTRHYDVKRESYRKSSFAKHWTDFRHEDDYYLDSSIFYRKRRKNVRFRNAPSNDVGWEDEGLHQWTETSRRTRDSSVHSTMNDDSAQERFVDSLVM
jgi:hypothetical protein